MGKIKEEGREEGELHRDSVAAKGTRRKKRGGGKDGRNGDAGGRLRRRRSERDEEGNEKLERTRGGMRN
jgi:hypothetical protein